jgi:transposase
MEVIVDRAAGLDLHKDVHWACLLITEGREVIKKIESFGTTKDEVLRMKAWLLENKITAVAMESTGEFWKPVYELLEGSFELVVANAQHIKNVPGRKTDRQDCAWNARLLRHGLLTPSFVPEKSIRDLRDCTRSRRRYVQTLTAVKGRITKVLEQSGVKLGSVASDPFGVSGMLMLRDLAAGRTDPAALAQHAKRKLRKKIPELERAFESNFRAHHSQLLAKHLDMYDAAQNAVAAFEALIAPQVAAHESLIARLDLIPGIDRTAAIAILGEIGTDMSAWKGDRFIAAWSGLAPGNNQSGGKRKRAPIRKGNIYLKTILVEVAQAAVKTNGTHYQARFRRMLARGVLYKKALVAIARKILITIYHMIARGTEYRELGADYQNTINKTKAAARLVRSLEKLGFKVQLQEPSITA